MLVKEMPVRRYLPTVESKHCNSWREKEKLEGEWKSLLKLTYTLEEEREGMEGKNILEINLIVFF